MALENRHAADLRVATAHDQPGRSNGSCSNRGEKMNGSSIVGIQLDFCGHTLLSNKHLNANSKGLLQFLLRGSFLDRDSCFHCAIHGMKRDMRLIAFTRFVAPEEHVTSGLPAV